MCEPRQRLCAFLSCVYAGKEAVLQRQPLVVPVLEAAKLLERFQVDFNILTVVTAKSARRIRRIYRFFQEQGFAWQQYIPCIDPFEEERGNGSLSYSLTPERYAKFLKDLFDDCLFAHSRDEKD